MLHGQISLGGALKTEAYCESVLQLQKNHRLRDGFSVLQCFEFRLNRHQFKSPINSSQPIIMAIQSNLHASHIGMQSS